MVSGVSIDRKTFTMTLLKDTLVQFLEIFIGICCICVYLWGECMYVCMCFAKRKHLLLVNFLWITFWSEQIKIKIFFLLVNLLWYGLASGGQMWESNEGTRCNRVAEGGGGVVVVRSWPDANKRDYLLGLVVLPVCKDGWHNPTWQR